MERTFRNFFMVEENMEIKTPDGTAFLEKYDLLEKDELEDFKNCEGFDADKVAAYNFLPHQWDWVRGVRVANPTECFFGGEEESEDFDD